jgi:hypothetical protein
MSEQRIDLHFGFASDADAAEAARLVRERLANLDPVEEAAAEPEEARFPVAEIAVGIGAAVTLVRGGRELLEELRRFVAALKGLVGEIRGLKDVEVEVGPERIPLAEVTDEHLQKLAR